MRHNNIHNFMAKTFEKVCCDVQIEPTLESLEGSEDIKNPNNVSYEARLDVSARGFWILAFSM